MRTMRVVYLIVFQSTLPVGGATTDSNECVFFLDISIHAPRGGSDTRVAM